MENLDAYLRRKSRELALIESFLPDAAPGPRPENVDDVIARKFRAASALRAAQARSGWQVTETHWSAETQFHAGPFRATYNYQRADLAIRGPSIYAALRGDAAHRSFWSGYTSCGMAAIATLAAAYGQTCPGGAWVLPSHGYPETRELVSLYGRRFGFVPLFAHLDRRASQTDRLPGRALFIDSGAATPGALCAPAILSGADLILFDTTCLAASSGRIAAILYQADEAGVPVVLLRSHTKLDSFGIEYGRLGSIVMTVPQTASARRRRMAESLAAAVDTARRLFGAAALPGHLPPFAAGVEWNALCRLRTARIIHNNRKAARVLGTRMCAAGQIRLYRHGLFFTIAPRTDWDEMTARRMAISLVQHLHAARLPVRHAGSFGFDFTVANSYPSIEGAHSVLRIALSDLPDELADKMLCGIAAWMTSQPFACAR